MATGYKVVRRLPDGSFWSAVTAHETSREADSPPYAAKPYGEGVPTHGTDDSPLFLFEDRTAAIAFMDNEQRMSSHSNGFETWRCEYVPCAFPAWAWKIERGYHEGRCALAVTLSAREVKTDARPEGESRTAGM